jgi:acyl-CoA synthetase (AMP-forming)/AMP-acid ligase II
MTASSISTAHTLVGVLHIRAAETPDRLAFEFSPDGDEVRDTITFGQLYDRALRIAAHIRERAGVGTPVMLLFPSGLEFIEALFGTLAAGAIAVPCYPPSPTKAAKHLERLADVARAAPAGLVMTTEDLRAQFAVRASFLPADCWMTHAAAAGDHSRSRVAAAAAMEPSPTDIALVQFTSGSTSQPRGVVIPHATLMANQEAIHRTFATSDASRVFTWLPFYHDMGLIGQVLHPVYLGASCSIIPPLRFMQSPQRWLLGMTRFRATITAAPNAAYDLCRHLVPDNVLPQIDLSSLQVAINGAEPVRHDTLVEFARRFEPCGFRSRAFQPAYGLAENTLLVSAARSEEGPPSLWVESESLALGRFVPSSTASGKAQVSAGRPAPGTRVTIVDAATDLPCPPGVVGEGDSVGHGYRTAHGLDTATFQPPRAAGQEWGVKTGDLGCLWDGELFIVGRSKDVVIVAGRNIYPQDIERTVAESHEGFFGSSGAAFGVARQDREGLVVVHGYRRQFRDQLPELARAARTAVRDAHDVAIQDFVFVEPHGIPRTSSGKIQRRKCRDLYLTNALPRAATERGERTAARDEPASLLSDQG